MAEPVCLLLVGKTGNGKSTLGNNILGKSSFEVKAGMASKTRTSSIGTDKHKNWKVIDTQDILNQFRSESDRRTEVAMWQKHQPTVVLLVIKAESRYTREEFELYLKVKELWGPGLSDRLAVVFTFGEACPRDIEYELEHASEELRTVLRDAKGRYCVFGSSGEMPEKIRSRKTLDDIVDALFYTGAAYGRGAGGAVGGAYGGTPSAKSQQKQNILIVGKTGSGKSTVGNILLGEDKFSVPTGLKPHTKTAQSEECKWFTLAKVKVIDTPDIFITHKGADQRKEVTIWVEKANQDIDIILLCIRTDKWYSGDEHAQFLQVQQILREMNQNPCLIVIFTNDGSHNQKIDRANPKGELKAVLEAAGGRGLSVKVKSTKDRKVRAVEVATRIIELKGQHWNQPVHPTTNTSIIASSHSTSGAWGAGAAQSGKEWSILIIGKTGGGKSTVGNILLGGHNFQAKASSPKLPVGKGMTSQTLHETTAKGMVQGINLKVIDAPDISNTDFQQRGQMNGVDRKRKVDHWKTLTYPGPDVILLVVRADGRYTAEENAVYDTVKRMWGPGELTKEFTSKLVVAFTFVDPKEKTRFPQVLRDNASQELNKVLTDARDRYVIFDLQDPLSGVRELFRIMTSTGNPHHKPAW